MKKSTKGALATGGAAFLLLGAAGSLAYWTDDADVSGTALESGHLEVINNDCGTGTWQLDNAGGDASAVIIVPGDTISKTCSFEIDGEGDHFDDVAIDIASPAFTAGSDGALVSALGTVSATYTGDTVGTINDGDDIPVGEVVTATFSMTFSTATTGDTAEDVQAELDTVAITVTQNHL